MPKNIARPKSNAWKDRIDRNSIQTIANEIKSAFKKFNNKSFVETLITPQFLKLELKERINQTATVLADFLPSDYKKATEILIKAAPNLGEFENWILTAYIELFGLKQFKVSIDALETLTRYSTSEFAVRPFMIAYPDKMISYLHKWSKDKNEHVRRLAAEASRPRGVWVAYLKHYIKNPREVLELLDELNADSSLYVRKAVANCLNDISKDHPELVIKTAKKWQKRNCKETDWIIKQGCRSLIKNGYPPVFLLFGFAENPKISINGFKLNKNIYRLGERLAIDFSIKSREKKQIKLSIDYAIHYQKKSGNLSPKVYKITERELSPGTTLELKINHKLIDNTTRKHYAGEHCLELIINGKSIKKIKFELQN